MYAQSDSTFAVHLDTSDKRIHLEDFAKGDAKVYSERELILFFRAFSIKRKLSISRTELFPLEVQPSLVKHYLTLALLN